MVISRTFRRFCPTSVNKHLKSYEMGGTSFIPFLTPLLNFLSNKNNRNRLLVICFLTVLFLIYLFPGLLSVTKNRLMLTSAATDCISPFLADFEHDIQSSNVRISTYSSDQALSPLVNGGRRNRPDPQNFNSLGFVGNGRYGFILQRGGALLIGNLSDKTLSRETQKDFNPIHFAHIHSATGQPNSDPGDAAHPNLFSGSSKFKASAIPFSGALIVDFLNGVATSMECYRIERKCVTIEHSYLFHRSKSNLFIEKFIFRNELTHSVRVSIESFMHGCSSSADGGRGIPEGGGSKTTVAGKLFCRVEGNVRHSQFSNLVILQQIVEEPVRITAQSKTTLYVLSAIGHSVAKSLDAINDDLTKMLEEVLPLNLESLVDSHKNDWNKIWTTGINVGVSNEDGAPTSTAVNETLYHILSSIEEPLLQSANQLTESEQKSLQQLIRHPDHTCFNGIPNIDAFQLWNVPTRNFEELKDAIHVWHLTLKKSGCSKLLTAGLSGLYEAVVLSVFALQFSEEHLALRAQPTFFHRNMSVRHVTYKDCSLNLGVSLLPDGHAELNLASEKCSQGFHLYACDAGCSKPQLLGSRELKFAVMETVPNTPILYISESMSHLTDLKRTIHYRSIHRFYSKEFFESKTKPYKALPTAFWVVVAFVIVAFHIFLVILLYREYWVGGGGTAGGSSAGLQYDYPSSIRTTGSARHSREGSSRGGAGSFISNYSVPNFTTHLYSKSNSFKK